MSLEHRRGMGSVLLLTLLAVMLCIPAAGRAADPEGEWLGKVKRPDKKDAEIKLTLTNAGGNWQATLKDELVGDVTLTDVRVQGNNLSFKFQPQGVPYPATFAGLYDPEHDRLSGTFTVRGSSRFVWFKRTAGGDMPVEVAEEPKEPARIRHDYTFGLNGRLSQWSSFHVIKTGQYNINACTKRATNFDGAAKIYLKDGFCLFGRYYRGGQNFTQKTVRNGQWPNTGISGTSYFKLDGWEVGITGFFGNKFLKTSRFNPFLTGAAGQVTWELNKDGRGSEVIALGLNPLQGTSTALAGGVGTEYEINQKLHLEFEVLWRFFNTEDKTIWPDVDKNWSNTHVWAFSFGVTYGIF